MNHTFLQKRYREDDPNNNIFNNTSNSKDECIVHEPDGITQPFTTEPRQVEKQGNKRRVIDGSGRFSKKIVHNANHFNNPSNAIMNSMGFNGSY